MAYVVGSASVEIVPDFRTAQLQITRFFQNQPDQLRVPVRPEMDQQAVQQAEVQARTVGNKLGAALAEGADRGVNRGGALGAISRRIAKLESDIEKSRTASSDATRQLHIAETRLAEGRTLKLEPASARMLSLERAVAVARERIIDIDRRAANASTGLEAARRELEEATRAEIEKTARAQMEAIRKADEARERADQAQHQRRLKEEAAERARAEATQVRLQTQLQREQQLRDRANEQEVQAEIRNAQRVAAEQERINRQAEATASRERERALREEESWARRQAQAFTRAYNQAVRSAEREKVRVEIDTRQAIDAGRQQGGLVARSVRHEIHQNAGLIAAAVGGALLLGGPAILAASTAVFGGIAAVAVAQNETVRRTWVGLWDEIKSNAQSDANVLVPTFERMAGQIGQSFQRMRPMIRDTYDELGNQFEIVTASVTQMAENALPGLTRAIREGAPVAQGFGDLLEDIGTGTSDFFSILAGHSATGGQVFRDLGGMMREVLPLLAELLGVGMEVATTVLPLMTGALRGVNTVLQSLEGILPGVVTGFLAFRAVQGISRTIDNWGLSVQRAALNAGQFDGAMGRAGRALTGLSTALPIVGLAFAAYGYAMAESEKKVNDWSQALMEGGVRKQQIEQLMAENPGAEKLTELYAEATNNVKALEASMDPLSFAKHRLEQASNNLSVVLADENSSAQDVAAAQSEVAHWSARAASEQEKLERATTGVTEAMVAQSEAARSLADSQFKYENALNDLEDAMADYKAAMEDTGASEEDRARALLKVQEGYNEVASAAREVAFDAMPAMLNEQQKAILADKAQLDSLDALHNQYGDLGPILEGQRTRLRAIIDQSDGAALSQAQLAAALGEVGIAVETIPGEKAVRVDALTEEAQAQLEAIGIDVIEMPDGSFKIVADGDDATEKINDIATGVENLDGKTATPSVDLDTNPYDVGAEHVNTANQILGGQRPTPVANLDAGAFNSGFFNTMGSVETLNGQRPTPIAELNASPFNNGFFNAMGSVGTLDGQRPTPIADMNDTSFMGSFRNAIARTVELHSQRPVPRADLNDTSFMGSFRNAIARTVELHSQRPTPTANMNNGPFTGIFGNVMSRLGELARQRPTPTVSINDNASGTIQSIRSQMASLQSRTITVTTVNRVLTQAGVVPPQRAQGGEIPFLPVQGLAFGGQPRHLAQGSISGRGGPREDLVPLWGSPGEHMLDARDVALMGGQAGVYAFREMLNQGRVGNPATTTGVRQMVAAGSSAPAAAVTSTRDVRIYTSDNPAAIVRTLRAEQQQHEALASPWP